MGLVLGLACAAPPPPAPKAAPDPDAFSGARAFAHLKDLVALGPRVAGTEQEAKARQLVTKVLEGLGLHVTTQSFDLSPGDKKPTLHLVNTFAEVKGASSDLFLLAAPLDTAPGKGGQVLLGANEGASGAAVLMELARVIKAHPLPYTVRFAFLDGEYLEDGHPWLGSQALVHSMAASGELQKLRLLVYVDRVGDRDLQVSRDLRSHRVYRERFFRAAARLGYAKAFPDNVAFDDVPGGERAFEAAGFRNFVALMDLRYGGDTIPGPYWRTDKDTPANCSAESLGTVGQVMNAGLRDIGALLHKVDSFATPEEPTPVAEQSPKPTKAPSKASAEPSAKAPAKPSAETSAKTPTKAPSQAGTSTAKTPQAEPTGKPAPETPH